jgi:hypothetical protein
MTSNKALIIWAIITTLGLVIAYFVWLDQQGVHKLIMPGQYSIYLPAGSYRVYYFWKWPTKWLDERQQKVELHISDSNNAPIAPDPYPPPSPPAQFLLNVGREEFDLGISKAGQYRFACQQRCIFLVVPAEREYGFDATQFPGAHDDFNFDKPSSSQI